MFVAMPYFVFIQAMVSDLIHSGTFLIFVAHVYQFQVDRYRRKLGMPPLTMQEEGLTKWTSCPSHCPRSGAS